MKLNENEESGIFASTDQMLPVLYAGSSQSLFVKLERQITQRVQDD